MKTTKGCDNCDHSGRPSYAYPCCVCIGKNKWEAKAKPQTNADHIRSMTDEELAEAFGGSCICSYIQDHDKAFCKERAVCTNCIKDWLQQPYKENEDER